MEGNQQVSALTWRAHFVETSGAFVPSLHREELNTNDLSYHVFFGKL